MYNVLIVDDEKIEREGIRFLLSREEGDFHILEASNGKQALNVLRSENIDLLLTDIKMPHMDGLELSKRAKEENEELQIVIFSGYNDFTFAQEAIRDGVKESVPMAMAKNLRNIHLGATIVGIYRQDVYEIPPDAIRELIINAMVHRSYLDHGTIQVAVYDNRLEITSPGKLPMGQTMERMKEGYSKIRNEALAHAFAYMNLIEHWGSGIPRIIDKVKAAGLRELEFIGGEVDLRINIYRDQVATNNAMINANGTKNGANGVKCGVDDGTNIAEVPLNKEQTQIEKLLQIIEKNPSATQAYYAEKMGISKRTISRMFASLQEKGRLVQGGTKRKANWKIIR